MTYMCGVVSVLLAIVLYKSSGTYQFCLLKPSNPKLRHPKLLDPGFLGAKDFQIQRTEEEDAAERAPPPSLTTVTMRDSMQTGIIDLGFKLGLGLGLGLTWASNRS